jgi:hypothetical protein
MAALLISILAGLASAVSGIAVNAPGRRAGEDIDLYRAVIARVERGEPYASAAVAEHRLRG